MNVISNKLIDAVDLVKSHKNSENDVTQQIDFIVDDLYELSEQIGYKNNKSVNNIKS